VVRIGGVLSTSLARPLYPTGASPNDRNVSLISAQGYLLSIEPDGSLAGSTTASFESADCSGPALIFAGNIRAGSVFGAGFSNSAYFVPRTAPPTVTNPTRNSRSTSTVACEANVSAFVGVYYRASVNNPATTGVDLGTGRPINLTVDFAP
jgi:hypothetical protein